MSTRFDELLDRYVDDELGGEDRAELEGLLRANPALRKRLVERMLLETQLRRSGEGTQRSLAPVHRAWRIGPGLAAAALLFVSVGVALYFMTRPEAPKTPIQTGDGQAVEPADGVPTIQGPTVRGRVERVDVDGRSITLAIGDKASRQFHLAADAVIAVDGRRSAVADIPAGSEAVVTLDEEQSAALAVSVAGATVSARIISVNPTSRTLTVAVGKEGLPQRVLFVRPGASIVIDGREASLDALGPGMRPTVQLSTDGKHILQIRIGRDREGGEGQRRSGGAEDAEDRR